MRFRKRIKVAPGVSLSIGKKSAGIRVGGRGYGISSNTSTGTRATVGIPGSGVSYSKKLSSNPNAPDRDPEATATIITCLVVVAVVVILAVIIFVLL